MAEAIRKFRAAVGDTQREFAHRTELTLTSIARYETNSPPSEKVLAKFSALARKMELPVFIDIFEGRVQPPPGFFEDYEVAAISEVVKSSLDEIHLNHVGYKKAKLLFAVHLLSPSQYGRAEQLFDNLIGSSVVEEALNREAAESIRLAGFRTQASGMGAQRKWTPETLVNLLILTAKRDGSLELVPNRSDAEWDSLKRKILQLIQQRPE